MKRILTNDRGGSPLERFQFCATRALADHYLWMLVFNNANEYEGSERAGLEDILDIINEDGRKFTEQFFEQILDKQDMSGDTYNRIVGKADDSTDEYAAMHNHVHHALEGVYWKQRLNQLKTLGQHVSDGVLTQEFSDDADRITDLILKYAVLSPIVEPIRGDDFDLCKNHFINRRAREKRARENKAA